MAKAAKKPDPKTINFIAPSDVKRMLVAAEKATGSTRTELIIEAIRTDLSKVVEKIIEKRREDEREYFRIAQPESQTQSRTRATKDP